MVVGGGQHGLAVRLRDERGGHAVRGQAHDDERVTGHVVVDDEAGGLGACDVVELGLEGEGASLDQHDLSGEALGVLGLERGAILGGADAAVDVFEGAAGQVGQVGHLLAVSAPGPLEGNVAVADGEGAVRQRVIDRGDRDHGGVGRRLALGGGVRVGREGQVLAGGIAVSGRVVVAGCRVDVRAVRSGLSGRRGVRVVVRIVVGEGELLRHVGAGLAVTQLGGQGRHLVRRERGGSPEGARERRVRHVDARVDDGDDLALALLGDLVGVHHQLSAEVGGVLGGGTGGVCRALAGDLVVSIRDAGFAITEGGLDAARRADRVEGACGGVQREALQGVVILAVHLGGGAGERAGHGLVDGSEGGGAVGTVVELDDDADDGGGVGLVGRLGLLDLGGLPALRGQRGVDVAHGQGRGRGTRVGSGVRRCWWGCEGRGAGNHERCGASQREERRWFLRCHVRNSNV